MSTVTLFRSVSIFTTVPIYSVNGPSRTRTCCPLENLTPLSGAFVFSTTGLKSGCTSFSSGFPHSKQKRASSTPGKGAPQFGQVRASEAPQQAQCFQPGKTSFLQAGQRLLLKFT